MDMCRCGWMVVLRGKKRVVECGVGVGVGLWVGVVEEEIGVGVEEGEDDPGGKGRKRRKTGMRRMLRRRKKTIKN